MSLEIIVLILTGFVVGTSLVAVRFWRTSQNYRAILREGASRFEDARKRLSAMEEERLRLQKNIDQALIVEKQMAGSLRDRNQRIGELEKQLELKQAEIQHKINSLELQKNHLLKQIDSLTDQLMLAEQSLAHEKTEKAQLAGRPVKSDYDDKMIQKLHDKTRQLEHLLRQKDSTILRLEEQLKLYGPEKVNQVKRRLAHYERLYQGMKSLRDMADERSSNWEQALRKMAKWILAEKRQESESRLDTIGPLVGSALEAIGEPLISDANLPSEHEAPSSNAAVHS